MTGIAATASCAKQLQSTLGGAVFTGNPTRQDIGRMTPPTAGSAEHCEEFPISASNITSDVIPRLRYAKSPVMLVMHSYELDAIKGATTLKNLLLTAALLLPATAIAAPKGVTLTHEGAVTEFHGTPGLRTLPKFSPPKGGTVIFNTLGKSKKTYSYDDSDGWTIANPGSEAEDLQWFAYAITPTSDVTVTEIVEAVSYVTGTDSVTVSLLADAGGVPGAVLASKTVKSLETFGDCCAVAVAKVKGVALTAGTTYWIGATLPSKKESTTWDAWCLSTYNTGSGPAAYYNTSGWNAATEPYAAFAVYGK